MLADLSAGAQILQRCERKPRTNRRVITYRGSAGIYSAGPKFGRNLIDVDVTHTFRLF